MNSEPLSNCGKCGLCLSVCPVYSILKEEPVSPRAKLQLIKAHDRQNLVSSPLLKQIVSTCLMCGACTATCPAGIDHYSEFMAMRRKMADAFGDPPAIRSLIYLLAREYRLKLCNGLARAGQKIMPDVIARTVKLGNIPLKKFPRLNDKLFRTDRDRIVRPENRPVGRVLYFTGCATNYMFADTGAAAVGILRHMGFEVIIPADQSCCSIPLLFHGASDKALANIRANIRSLSRHEADAILVDCSTCGEALKREYPRIIDPAAPEFARAETISSKVTHILSFIDDHDDLLAVNSRKKERIRVTYHAPCHTRNSSLTHLSVENLLEGLPNVEYHRAADAHNCCGGGGTFFYEYPRVSKQLVEKKIETVRSMDVSLWLTDCPVCRVNLSGNLDLTDTCRVLHPLSLIYSRLYT